MSQTSVIPTIGRVILVRDMLGSEREEPAIVTGIISDTIVSARVFTNGIGPSNWMGKVMLAEKAPKDYTGAVWRWPPRV